MSSRSHSPMEQGEIEASPDLHGSPGIILDPDDDYVSRQTTRSSDKEKPGKSKRDSRSPDRHEDVDDVLNIQPPQITHVKKDKHRHHRHSKGDGHKRATREGEKYVADRRDPRDDRQIRKYEDKPRVKHSKRETEMSSVSREFAKQQMQQDREVEALRRQKSQQERERLERLERERYRIEKERQMKEREYWAKMKKSEQEQAARNDQERRQQRKESFWRRDDRDRQESEDLMKRRAKDMSKKGGGRPRSRTRSRSPLLRPLKEKEARRIPSNHRRDDSREVRQHGSWMKDKRGSDQDREHDHDHEDLMKRRAKDMSKKGGSGGRPRSHTRSRSPLLRPLTEKEVRRIPSNHRRDDSREVRQHGSWMKDKRGSDQDREHDHDHDEDTAHSKFDDDDEEEDERRSESGDRDSGVYMKDSPIPSSPEMQLQLPPYFPALQGCRNIEEFQCLNRIEEGTYGVVYRAIDLKTDEVVALKRLKMERETEGFPITSLREIKTQLKAQHRNIVTLREIVVGSNMDKIYIVMDYVEHDLKSLMEHMKEPFSIG